MYQTVVHFAEYLHKPFFETLYAGLGLGKVNRNKIHGGRGGGEWLHLKGKSGFDKIIVKRQPYQLLNTSREFFPIFRGSNFHKFDD